jgi:hypothetical protein
MGVSQLKVARHEVTANKQTIEILEELLEAARKGEIIEIAAIALRPDGKIWTKWSTMEDRYKMAGAIELLKLKAMGFVHED